MRFLVVALGREVRVILSDESITVKHGKVFSRKNNFYQGDVLTTTRSRRRQSLVDLRKEWEAVVDVTKS